MVEFDIEKIINRTEQDFEKTWVYSAKLIPRDTQVELKGKGQAHPVRNMIQKSRRILLYMGFSEIENKTILPDTDVYKEYGPEAPVILDRAFYLAKMPRPDIGLGNNEIKQIKEVIGDFEPKTLQRILRFYKKGEIEGDDFIEELVKQLEIPQEKATELLESKVFSEFKNLTPQPTNSTLRSHMTATWYHTLAALQDKTTYPLALFSVGPRYRNEQREDKGHLRVHHSASIVIMDPNMSLEAGRKITEEVLKKYGFDKVKFETKKATSKYYVKDQEQEVFVKHGGEWLEIADIGMYSAISLANFGIKYPVFNAGFGIERLEMVLGNHKDIRELVYPQFSVQEYSDEEIAKSISYIHEPQTERGKKIAEAIEMTARKHKDEIAPCEFIAYEDDQVLVKVVEREEGKRLIGPAGFNEVHVKDGNINSDLRLQGVSTGLNYMKGISTAIAHQIEENFSKNEAHSSHKVKLVRSLPDINLKLPHSLEDYLTGNYKKFNVRGPVFITVDYLQKQK